MDYYDELVSGKDQIVNIYYDGVLDTGINARMGARIRIDGNHFENASNGIIAGPKVGSTVSYKPAYDYSLVPTTSVKAHVLNNAGVGKLQDCR